MKIQQAEVKRAHRIRFHISEDVAAELAYDRRQGAFKSWDDYYRALISKWRETPESLPFRDLVVAKITAMEAQLKVTSVQVQEFAGRMESFEDIISGLELGQEQMLTVAKRIHLLLDLAFHLEEKDSSTETPANQGSEIIRKFRNREI
jgi:hypothetical protein